jgi:hypothetical protein
MEFGRQVLSDLRQLQAEKRPNPTSHRGSLAMSLPPEVDDLVQQLSYSLEPPQRHAFIDAAQAALGSIPCLGVGVAYRTLAGLQRKYFDPPCDRVAYGPSHHRQNKLNSLPPVGAEDARGTARRVSMWARR